MLWKQLKMIKQENNTASCECFYLALGFIGKWEYVIISVFQV